MPHRSQTMTAEGYLPSELDLQEAFDLGESSSLRTWLGLDGGPPLAELEALVAPPVPAKVPPGSDPAVSTQLPASGPGFYSYTSPEKRFAHADAIRAVRAIGLAWARAHPSGPRIAVGDISRQGGGQFPPHSSHRGGLDVDLRPVRGDGTEAPVTYKDPAYSRALTQELVNLVRANGVVVVQHVLFNDPQVTGVSSSPGHDNHLHVRFTTTPAPPGASQPAPPQPPTSPVQTGPPQPAAAGPPAGLGTLVVRRPGGTTFRYRFTPADMVWTARFIVGEAGGQDTADNRAVIWAMFNRYGLFTHRLYPTFHQFLRAYSTPLQPVLNSWGAARRNMNKPDYVRTGGTYVGRGAPPGIPRGQRRRYLELQRRPWAQLPASARGLAEAALKGRVPNPIGTATEFASTYVYYHDRFRTYPTTDQWRQFTQDFARRKGWTWIGPVAGLNQQRNAFFIDRRSAGLPRDAVRVEPG
jgi:Penicillin-insensitive murein endopeptidase